MGNWRSDHVTANGIKMHYTRTGGDGPPVVLCHGSTDNGLCWTPVARALEADYDVVMPDARGHGLTDAPESGYDVATRAADLAAFVAALGLERPVVGGHSMGASTTLCFAAGHPDMLRAAVLEDGGIRMPGYEPPYFVDVFIPGALDPFGVVLGNPPRAPAVTRPAHHQGVGRDR